MSKKRKSYDSLALVFFILAFVVFVAGIICAFTLTTEVETSNITGYITRTKTNYSLVAMYIFGGTFSGLICFALGKILQRTYLLCKDIKNQW